MFSVLISYLLSLFIVFIQVFFLAGGFIVFSTNLHISSSVTLATLIYVISFTYIIPSIVLSRLNPIRLDKKEHVAIFNKINGLHFRGNKGRLKFFESKNAPFFVMGSLLGSGYVIINSAVIESLSPSEMDKYLEAELSFNETINAKVLTHILIVLLFWRGIFNWVFKLARAEAVFRYMFAVPRRLFNRLSNSFKSYHFKKHESVDMRGVAQKVIYLENAKINDVHFNVASTTMWSILRSPDAMDERFHQSELL
ncbi:hypothetical protein ABMA79_13040 [Halobacteriovorax sp. HFRX-2_2]|uniref:hypothetical protein n=1 Tax=unclassified Halobacteriovorax TaxID=2639665 RepID=UPI003710BB0C